VEVLPSDQMGLITELISEAVLGTKEVNERARDAGFDLVVAMGHKMAKGGMVRRDGEEAGDGEDIKVEASKSVIALSAPVD
jgi:ribosomal RNA-processing protein 12